MSRRKYTHIQALEQEILRMRQGGATRQEIADRFGLSKSQIKNWINRYNHKQAKMEAGITATAERTATKRFCARRYYRGAGIRDQAIENGE